MLLAISLRMSSARQAVSLRRTLNCLLDIRLGICSGDSATVEAGLGIYRTRDTRRDPTVGDWDDEYIYHYRRWTLAPSRLELSFSYLF